MLRGLLPSDPSVGRRKAGKLPAVVRRPMVSVGSAAPPVNQRLPSGPAVMPSSLLPGTGNKVMLPLGVMRPIVPALSVNQRLPSGPAVMPKAVPEGTLNSVTVPATAQAGAVLRLSRPTPAIRAVTSAVRWGRHPERFMLVTPFSMVLLFAACFLAARYARTARLAHWGEFASPGATRHRRRDSSSRESLTTRARAVSLQRQHLGLVAFPSGTSTRPPGEVHSPQNRQHRALLVSRAEMNLPTSAYT